ncbi:superoxide dismutase [Candidatus Pacearchaeota archaeon]|nr:superoxide dismutase [Candidatus Pacearchaeota archaeon]
MNKYTLPKLPYAFDALEPYMDAKTVEIHYTKHHQGYCDKLNLALEKHPALFDKKVEDLLIGLDSVPLDIKTAVRNFGGGFVNHNLFWECMSSKKSECSGKILTAIKNDFGSFEEFRKQFTASATTLFGSGYTWLVLSNGKLEIMNTKDQDSPLSVGKKPVLVIDVWEHSYYLKYQNKRADFIDAWWDLVNWAHVEKKYLD